MNSIDMLYTSGVLRIYENIAKKFRSDPVYNAEMHDRINAEAHSAVDTEHPERWNLHVLAVSPERQRKGIGGLLLGWGVEKGREEGVPVALEASPGGIELYLKVGFVVVETIKITEDVDLPVMLLKPKGGNCGS